jgi:hypothetical protein
VLKILVPDVIGTFRDIGRLVGTFHVLAGMLNKEVDWIDLLGYCTLLIKAPQITDAIKSRPDDFTDDILTEAAMMRRMVDEKLNPAEQLSKIIPGSEAPAGTRRLIGFLFPRFSESSNRSPQEDDVPDALYRRRPLLTTLRLGLLPGDYSRAAIDSSCRRNRPRSHRRCAKRMRMTR